VPLDLPNLDDLTWQELSELGRASIPGWAPEWTNHNAADPGITFVELFAYLSEILIYRVNRISATNIWAFLRLINGPERKLPKHLDEAKRQTLEDLHRTRRAVTAEDFERLALDTNKGLDPKALERIARAKAIFRRNLTTDDPAYWASDAPGFVSVIVVANAEGSLTEPSAEIREKVVQRVQEAMEPARLLTTRVRVVKPRYLLFGVQITLVIPTNVSDHEVRQAAIDALENFFNPIKGGPQKRGWPFGRDVYVSEVYEILARLPGVKLVKRSIDPHNQRSTEELFVRDSEAGRRRLNQDGKLEALHVDPHELVRFDIQAGAVTVVYEHQWQRAE
jgi:hypothetical protein